MLRESRRGIVHPSDDSRESRRIRGLAAVHVFHSAPVVERLALLYPQHLEVLTARDLQKSP